VRWRELPPAPPGLLAEAAAHWVALERAEPGVFRFPGPLCQLLTATFAAGRLQLGLGRTDYRLWLHAQGRREALVPRFGEEAVSRPLAVCAAVLTADGALVVAERGQALAEGAGLLHVCGGHVEPERHWRAGAPNPLVAMQAELEEEFGLSAAELADGRLLGLVESAAGKPELIWSFRVALDRAALAARAAAASDAREAAALRFPSAAPAALAAWREPHRARIAAPTLALLERLLGSP
jgi:8-oxo-dGTP pyrophosphatase MutT (NUDIX family)